MRWSCCATLFDQFSSPAIVLLWSVQQKPGGYAMHLARLIIIALIFDTLAMSSLSAKVADGPRVRAPIEVVKGRKCSTASVYARHPRRKKVVAAWEKRVARRWGQDWAIWSIALDQKIRSVFVPGSGGRGGSPPSSYWLAHARPCLS